MMGSLKKLKSILKLPKKISSENRRRGERVTNPFIFSEEQQYYYVSLLKSVGLSLANAINLTTACDYFAKVDIYPLVKEYCRTYASVIGRHDFKNLVSFYTSFEYDFIYAHQSHQNLSLNDVNINL